MREELLKIAKPILFNTEMVQAILEGRKSVTRRVIKNANIYLEGQRIHLYEVSNDIESDDFIYNGPFNETTKKFIINDYCKYQVGDILYVRETWKEYEKRSLGRLGSLGRLEIEKFYGYKTNESNSNNPSEFYEGNWKPSIHMPKKAARIFLKVTDIRVERLQDIELQDIIDEGINLNFEKQGTYTWGANIRVWVNRFIDLWDSTIKKQDLERYGWKANPWVWVIEFEKVEVE